MDDLVIDKARAAEFASYTTSIFLLGWAAGGLTLGALGDRYGRARMLTISVHRLLKGTPIWSASMASNVCIRNNPSFYKCLCSIPN